MVGPDIDLSPGRNLVSWNELIVNGGGGEDGEVSPFMTMISNFGCDAVSR